MRKQDIIAKIGEEVVYRQGGGRGRMPSDPQRAKLVGYYYAWVDGRQYGRNAPATLDDFVKLDEDRQRTRSYRSRRYRTNNKPGVLVEIDSWTYDDAGVRTPIKILTVVQPFELFDENYDTLMAEADEAKRQEAEREAARIARQTEQEELINLVIGVLGLDGETDGPYPRALYAEAKREGTYYNDRGDFYLKINMDGVRNLARRLRTGTADINTTTKETQAS